jgi:hypothetical protein
MLVVSSTANDGGNYGDSGVEIRHALPRNPITKVDIIMRTTLEQNPRHMKLDMHEKQGI